MSETQPEIIHDVCTRKIGEDNAAFMARLVAETNRLNRALPRLGYYYAPKRQYLVRFWPFAELRRIPWGLPGPGRWHRLCFWLGCIVPRLSIHTMARIRYAVARRLQFDGYLVLFVIVVLAWLILGGIFVACCR